MKNVSDIKRDENLNFVLSDKYVNNKDNPILPKQMAVFIHLHYADTVKNYFSYIVNIPESIDVYITVSDETTRMEIDECIKYYGLKNCTVIVKKNRGRDISALLVACRDRIQEYEYACFTHDKKEKNNYQKRDVQCWVEEIWENLIGSTEYIYNIKELLDKNEGLGLLVPPNPLTDQLSFAVTNTWKNNFKLTQKLAEELGLICEISEDKSPITLGTAFWCRVTALKKLFLKEWVYEDFQDEPLPDDGTISHAIERILAYVAQDAGYFTGNIMTDTYAGKQFEYRNIILMKSFEQLRKAFGIGSVNDLFNYDLNRKKIADFCSLYTNIYIYGAGAFGNKVLLIMQTLNKKPKAFVVSDGERIENDLYSIPILELSEVEVQLNDKCGIILGVSPRYIDEIKQHLEQKKVDFLEVFTNSH